MSATPIPLDEAVRFIMQSKTRQYRAACLAHWAEVYGEEFAAKVKAKVQAEWGKRKGAERV